MTPSESRTGEARYWLAIQEPRCVPERKGPFDATGMKAFIREAMDARPLAILSVLSESYDGPEIDHAGEWLTIADMRSASRVRRHNESSAVSHAELATASRPAGQGGEALRERVGRAGEAYRRHVLAANSHRGKPNQHGVFADQIAKGATDAILAALQADTGEGGKGLRAAYKAGFRAGRSDYLSEEWGDETRDPDSAASDYLAVLSAQPLRSGEGS